jgi:hypothetical protein
LATGDNSTVNQHGQCPQYVSRLSSSQTILVFALPHISLPPDIPTVSFVLPWDLLAELCGTISFYLDDDTLCFGGCVPVFQ